MAFSAVLHAFVVAIATWSIWVGLRIWVSGDLSLVRDHQHNPLPNAPSIAGRYATNALVSGGLLLALCVGTLLGLPFALWLGGVFVAVLVSALVRSSLISSSTVAREE